MLDGMRWTIGLLATLALLLSAPNAQAGVPLAPGPLDVRTSDCPGIGGACVLAGVAYVPAESSRFERAHELGHIFDARVLTDSDRRWFTRAFRAPRGTAWIQATGDACIGRPCPNEVFADAYAACRLRFSVIGHRDRKGRIVSGWTTAYDYRPTARQHRRVCARIRRAYGRVTGTS